MDGAVPEVGTTFAATYPGLIATLNAATFPWLTSMLAYRQRNRLVQAIDQVSLWGVTGDTHLLAGVPNRVRATAVEDRRAHVGGSEGQCAERAPLGAVSSAQLWAAFLRNCAGWSFGKADLRREDSGPDSPPSVGECRCGRPASSWWIRRLRGVSEWQWSTRSLRFGVAVFVQMNGHSWPVK